MIERSMRLPDRVKQLRIARVAYRQLHLRPVCNPGQIALPPERQVVDYRYAAHAAAKQLLDEMAADESGAASEKRCRAVQRWLRESPLDIRQRPAPGNWESRPHVQ